METYLYKGDVCIRSGDPSVFEALLSECPPDPDKIGAVRAAARAARMVQELVGQGKNPLGSGKFKKLLVFQGVDNEGRKPKAVFAVYNGRTGESGQPFRKTLPELNRLTADVADYGEHEAAIEALEALGNENAPSSRVAATKPEARRSFSQGAGAAAAPEVSKASVQFVRVTTEARKGVPHAEGVFCPAGVRQSMAEKTWLTAEQIEDKIASLAEDHPDRAVYKAALKQVELKDKELGSAPVRVMDEYRPR